MNLNRLATATIAVFALAGGPDEVRADNKPRGLQHDVREKVNNQTGSLASLNVQTTPPLIRPAMPSVTVDTKGKKEKHSPELIITAAQGAVVKVTGEHSKLEATSTNFALDVNFPLGHNGKWGVAPGLFLGAKVPVGGGHAENTEEGSHRGATAFIGAGLTGMRKIGPKDRFGLSLTAFGGAVGRGREWKPALGLELGLEATIAETRYADVAVRLACAAVAEGLLPDRNEWVIEPLGGFAITAHKKKAKEHEGGQAEAAPQ